MKYGFRPTVLIGMGLVLLGALLLALRAQTPQVAVVAVACFLIGLGLGLVAAPSLIAAQASVGWADRGVVTGANMFARSIGSAVGVAVFGAVANAVLDASGGPTNPDAVIDAGAAVFIAVLVATLLTIVSAVAMPKIRADDAELAQPAPGNALAHPICREGQRLGEVVVAPDQLVRRCQPSRPVGSDRRARPRRRPRAPAVRGRGRGRFDGTAAARGRVHVPGQPQERRGGERTGRRVDGPAGRSVEVPWRGRPWRRVSDPPVGKRLPLAHHTAGAVPSQPPAVPTPGLGTIAR